VPASYNTTIKHLEAWHAKVVDSLGLGDHLDLSHLEFDLQASLYRSDCMLLAALSYLWEQIAAAVDTLNPRPHK
jgi:hypothetical protein